ncbi:metal-dependent hydrolase family protein [Ammoniphilus resinae]|uniref:Imidazolonepropionase-like amidohydrolase n=1 Tax=Ammoniphilus resinae TaxID=861532 RepID=A0ABS4GLA2_9BACL|nr:amidohydrolase family protein [Ammoniphilus resinae]MBP1931026.1 imidazolonepropionase-like amidohydrolase [Ammoniphilus resinae]
MLKLIKADYLFDSIEGAFKPDPMVWVNGDQIEKVSFGTEPEFSDYEQVDLTGCTLLPGFIDAHDHLSLSPQLENHPKLMNDPDPLLMLRGIQNMKYDLSKGITTSRCLGDKNFIDIYLRDAVEQGIVDGPRIITCTRGIKASHAHGSVGTVFNGVENIRQAVRENLLRGADFIKLFITDTIRTSEYFPYYMSVEEIRVAVEEAHRVGKKVAVHAIGGDGLTHCVEQGVDVIEHAYFASDQQIDLMLKKNSWVVLTPSIFFNDNRWTTVPQAVAEGFYRNREEVLERHQAIIRSGMKYAVGTDATHGELHEDVIFLVEIGEKISRALQGITIHAAELCEREDQIGSISPGKKADLVAIKGNLQENPAALRSIDWVMKGGKTYLQK